MILRTATLDDVDQLVDIEERCFETDRLTRRNFRWMISRANGELIVGEVEHQIIGYVLVLFHKGTSLARIYSIALLENARGKGYARLLLKAGEDAALNHDCVTVRLEVRPDNKGAISLYEKTGYHFFSFKPHYYEDDSEALRYQKRVLFPSQSTGPKVPYYRQSTPFSCGPACLIMAMSTHDPSILGSSRLELQIWREATTIFMTSGHGGCAAHGLALSAQQRGFDVGLYVSNDDVPFIDSVRDEAKKDVIRQVHEDFLERCEEAGIKAAPFPTAIAEIEEILKHKGVPLVLISSYRLTGEKAPHWVVVSKMDDRFIYVNDPEVDEEIGKTETDCVDVPIRRSEFERMAQYGRSQLRAMVVVYEKEKEKC